MKKLVCFLAVIALAAPVYAQEDPCDVTIICEVVQSNDCEFGGGGGDGCGVIRVSYDASEGGAQTIVEKVRGFAMDIELIGDGCNPYYKGIKSLSFKTGESTSGSPGYGIFMGSILFNQQDPNKVDSWGDPQAPEDDPGAAGGPGDSSFTVELGSLYDPDIPGDAPGDSGVLFEFEYDCNDCCDEILGSRFFDVQITENAVRGGIVLEDGRSAPLVSAGCTVECNEVLLAECYPDDQPGYDFWLAHGTPDCWCWPRQCHGDVNNTAEGSGALGWYYVGVNDLGLLAQAWKVKEPPKGPGIDTITNGICADFDKGQEGSGALGWYRVGVNDLGILATYWKVKEPPKGVGVPTDCPRNFDP